MFDFTADPDLPKPERYRQLVSAAAALTSGETDSTANMANVAALMAEFLPGLNWAGFYRLVDGALILGPFIGRPACIHIALNQGVCGAAAKTGTTQLVKDVHAFPGHIACDAASRSELVVPVYRGDTICAVIDLDSPETGHFDAEDAAGIEGLARALNGRI
ncbi:GAF domain-containing protein [Pontixanthobacter sp.]|uniref:GAF domain-containing protein n=1 Tax=Pontixanthobacter sp. TaxID=2792078 RepID=UPI003C7B0F1D